MPTNVEYLEAMKSAQDNHYGEYYLLGAHPSQLFSHIPDASGKKPAEHAAPSRDPAPGWYLCCIHMHSRV